MLKEPIQIATARKNATITKPDGTGLISKHTHLFHETDTKRRRESETVEILQLRDIEAAPTKRRANVLRVKRVTCPTSSSGLVHNISKAATKTKIVPSGRRTRRSSTISRSRLSFLRHPLPPRECLPYKAARHRHVSGMWRENSKLPGTEIENESRRCAGDFCNHQVHAQKFVQDVKHCQVPDEDRRARKNQ